MSRAALMQFVRGGDIAEAVPVPRQFADDFELVANHYNLRELGEYEGAKQAASADLDNAITTYAALAAEIQEEA